MSLIPIPFPFKKKKSIESCRLVTDVFSNLFAGMPIYTCLKENVEHSNDQLAIKKKKKLSEIGYFDLLPDEIFIKILKDVEIEDLANCCLTNSKIRNFVIDSFLISKAGYTFLIRASQLDYDNVIENQAALFQLFTSIGVLIKKSTFVFPTHDRIDILVKALENTYGIPDLNTFNSFNFTNFKLIYKCYGRVFNKLTSGWGEFECAKVYKELKDKAQIDKYIDRFLKSSLGSKNRVELLIRHFYRMICNSTADESVSSLKEKLFWLIQELNVFEIDQIAKLLIVIFGPFILVNNAVYSLPYVAWWDLTDSSFLNCGFEDLGLVLQVYYNFSSDSLWSQDYVAEVTDKLINTPARWTSINIASLLYHTSDKFVLHFMRKQLKEENQQSVAEWLCYLAIITYKFNRKLKSFSAVIDTLVDQFGEELIERFSHAFTTIIYETDHFDEDNVDSLPLLDIIDAQLELMRLLMLGVYRLKKFI